MLSDLGPITNWILILGLVAFAIFLYIYSKGKSIHDEYDRKYQLLGTRGGKAEKTDEEVEELNLEEEDELMEFEKQEEKIYNNEKLN